MGLGSPALLIQLGSVLAVLAAAWAWMTRGKSRRGRDPVICLGPHHRLHVVRVDGRRLLVGVGPQGAPSLLCDLEPGASPESGQLEQELPRGAAQGRSWERHG